MNVYQDLINERKAQDDKWGEQNHDDGKWALILLEELGEAAKAALEGDLRGFREELVQAAAVNVAWVEAFDRRGMIRG